MFAKRINYLQNKTETENIEREMENVGISKKMAFKMKLKGFSRRLQIDINVSRIFGMESLYLCKLSVCKGKYGNLIFCLNY